MTETAPRDRPAVIHESASVEAGSVIGPDTRVWALSQIRTGATIGSNCVVGRNVFIDADVAVGDNVKIQNNASLFEGVRIDDGVFVGPHVIFTNDRVPRAVNPDGSLKSKEDWQLDHTTVGRGAAIGAGAVILAGLTIGRWAMVGSGSVVTRDVADHALVVGNPARVVGFVSAAGTRCDALEEAVSLTAQEIAAMTVSD